MGEQFLLGNHSRWGIMSCYGADNEQTANGYEDML